METAAVQLSPVAQKFILHWGEMGARWGINRTMAQMHALLYLSPRPMNAEQIAATLQVARSNVSSSLRELQSWGVVKVVHILGDRRDYFESLKDVWEMFRIIVKERKRREIDPTLTMLRECVQQLDALESSDRHAEKRVRELLEFVENMSVLYEEVNRLPTGLIRRTAKLRGKLGKALQAVLGK